MSPCYTASLMVELTLKHVRELDELLCLACVFHRAGLCHQPRPFVVPSPHSYERLSSHSPRAAHETPPETVALVRMSAFAYAVGSKSTARKLLERI